MKIWSGGIRRFWFAALLFAGPVVHAEVRLPAIFSDHMVLMRSRAVPVWGWAAAGEHVAVRVGDIAAETTADAGGRWRVKLDLMKASAGAMAVTVQGQNTITIQDVLVGAVWLSSGQSNMEFPLRGAIGAKEAIEQSANDKIRLFRVDKVGRPSPAEDMKGHWAVAGPETAGAFSAVAYYFAKDLQHTLSVPVGIIDNSWGGTISEWWLSPDAMNRVPELRDGEAARVALMNDSDKKRADFVRNYTQWLEQSGRQDKPPADTAQYLSDDDAPAGWQTVSLPGPVANAPGVYWIRKVLNITHQQAIANLEFKVMIGPMEGFDQFYWNGTKVAETPYAKFPGVGFPRYYPIPRALLREGKNVVTLRIYAPGEPPRLDAVPDNFWAGSIMLAGEWQMKVERSMPVLSTAQLAEMPHSPAQVPHGRASALYNGVVAPLAPYAIDGVIWYQGESDADRAWQYRVTFPLIIEDWRQKWGRSDLPFLFCELPRWGKKPGAPGESTWAELRESQVTALKMPHVYGAVLIDQGEGADLHPRQKDVVGKRLANIALAEVYGKKLAHQSPTFAGMEVRDGKAEIKFFSVNGSLVAHPLPATYDTKTLLGETASLAPNVPGSELQGFAICGEDHKWVWANARVTGRDKVLVWSELVPHPVAVRYAWSDNPTVNLFDSADLPAAPFRTDTLPASTLHNVWGAGS